MSGSLVQVSGTGSTGSTTEYIYYDNSGTYTLLGSTANVVTPPGTGVAAGAYTALVYLPPGDTLGNIVVYNQADTQQSGFTTTTETPVGATGDTGATGATGD